ncbi:hypothetical protein [Streptomyces sp. NRRL F-4474]|nr:hypothetical protein [Streptomyces sp. NRRL F-4474]
MLAAPRRGGARVCGPGDEAGEQFLESAASWASYPPAAAAYTGTS